MWEDQAGKYWKEKEALKKKDDHKKKVKYGLVALFVLCCFFGVFFGNKKKQKVHQEIKLFSVAKNAVLPAHRTACVAESSDDRRWGDYTCKAKCAFARSIPPEPAPYRACVGGCTRGGEAGFDLGCSAVISAVSCEARAKAVCEQEGKTGYLLPYDWQRN